MKNVYLGLAIVGAVVPYLFFFSFIGDSGIDLAAFLSAAFANGSAGGFTADLFISSLVFWIYLFTHPEGPKPWLFIALNLTIGLSCALPAYLYVRERRGGRSSAG